MLTHNEVDFIFRFQTMVQRFVKLLRMTMGATDANDFIISFLLCYRSGTDNCSNCLLCVSAVNASRWKMDWVLQRCKTYKQTESETSVNQQTELKTSVNRQTDLETSVSKQTESKTPVNKQTESEASVAPVWAVQLNNLPYVCTSLEITCLLKRLGIVILIIIILKK